VDAREWPVGAKTSLLVFADGNAIEILRAGPALDRRRARDVAARLYPGRLLTETADSVLDETCNSVEGQVYIGCYSGLSIVCTTEVAVDEPSLLASRILDVMPAREVSVHAMHSGVDWFAYAIWSDGVLRRSLSLSPDSGIIENIGDPLPFEMPYWDGKHPLELDPDDEPYPLPFHPLEMAEDALRELLGFCREGLVEDDVTDPMTLPVAGFDIR
jgi:hypothetical protein